MTDQLLQAIEERLAERRRASLGTNTDERREKALMSLVQRARNNDGDGKERLDKLLALFPQLSEWVAEQMALSPPMLQAVQPAQGLRFSDNPRGEALPERPSAVMETQREMARRQMREDGDAPSPPAPEPPKPEWYESAKPGLSVANRLKRLFEPKPAPGDGGWMRNR
jgi:hypothetical protein